MHGLARYGWVGFALAFPLLAHAACPDHAAVAAYVADFEAARVSQGFGNDLDLADAECAKGKLVQELPQVQGRVVGYKAAFTNPALQQRFGVTSPAWGVMFARMMVASGAKLPARFGARPLYEADFVAVVKDAALADAKTPLEALQHISAVVPFIELADLMLEGTPNRHGAHCHQYWVSGRRPGPARRGRAHPGVPGRAGQYDGRHDRGHQRQGTGARQRQRPHGASDQCRAMGCPGAQEGWGRAQAGDLLSLGGYIPPTPTQPGTSITVQYFGLPGDPSVTVHFE